MDKKHRKGLREALARQMRFTSDEQCEAMASVIETELPRLISDCFDVSVESVFDITSASDVRDFRNRLVTDSEAKRRDEESNGTLSQALKLYADFLDSKYNPAKKKPKAVKTPRPASKETPTSFIEGSIVQQTFDKRERNQQARKDCIDKKGCKCSVCGFDFEAVYGPVGRNYIEVHHLKPISQTDDEHEVTADDLVPLCANCHAMAHRRSPEPFTPEELKAFLIDANK
ncbi:MAG: HNH endonuclease [Muribaculum sp.]|nr:HNH endonuclease [Muribaculum sp.]